MATPGENNFWPKLLATVVVLLMLEKSWSLQEKIVFVLQENTSPKKNVVIVTRRNEEATACETFNDEKYSPNRNYILKSLTEKEMQNALKECDSLPKTRLRRQAKETGAKNCTGESCSVKNCSGASCSVKNCSGASCSVKNCTGASCSVKNCTGAGCSVKNCSGESCDATDCGGSGCGEEDCDDESCDNEQDEDSTWNIIFPGTKWCGNGQTARSFDDVGYLKNTDMCCRSHDNCNDTMAAGETKHNLTNKSLFTALNCVCDDDFYDCLSSVNSVVSNTIGRTYFNILRRSCYTNKEHRVCKTYRSFLKITCKEYENATSSPEVYTWKSPKRYRKLPIPLVG